MTPNNMFLPQDTSCVLLLKDVGGELKDVAKGTLIQPASRTMHNNPMDDDVMRVRLARVLPGCDDMDPLSTSGSRRTQDPWRMRQLALDMAEDPDSSCGGSTGTTS